MKKKLKLYNLKKVKGGYNYDNLNTIPGSNSGNVEKLKMELCSASLNPKQTWYVGA